MSVGAVRRIIKILATVGAMAACNNNPSALRVCTLIGCDSGLTVGLTSLPVGAFTVEVLVGPDVPNMPVYRYECTLGDVPCAQGIFFPGLLVEDPRVRVTTSLGTVTHQLEDVTYHTSRPNGLQCGPTCRSASVTVGIPE